MKQTMKTLWIFGDSFSTRFNNKILGRWDTNYCNWKGYVPKYFGDIIANELKVDVKHFGIGGCDNYTLFHSIIKVINLIKSDDIIIIGWSDILRFRIPNKTGLFSTIRAHNFTNTMFLNKFKENFDFSEQSIKEVLISRDNELYVYELNDLIHLLNHIFKTNIVIHWSPFHQKSLHTTIRFSEKIETINMETAGYVNDEHYSEGGQMKISNIFIDYIENWKKNYSNTTINLI